ncbi:SRPBCC family protein [Aldersonia kunmingensis]|uniref:SRPBCC family protein n=1 Tax=Aldersonia kunmingensis TaxID=408066 RepID=UPI001FE00761|nr:SRPBCC family protein [Aldersonia kunmingensis]
MRTRVLNWGARPAEIEAHLPGDDLLPDADGVATRAISIEASPHHIYPWLVQMGPTPRGGAYTYDWIENLFGLNMHSADHILDDFQHPRIGDKVGVGPNSMVVEIADPGHCFATRSADGNWVWAFTIVPDGTGARLISRNRFRLPRPADRIGMVIMEPGSLVMERKMLRGIKERAEQLAEQDRPGR